MTNEVRFLALDDIIAFHDEQRRLFGGAAGLREPGLLASAVAAPQMLLAYAEDSDLFDLAAAYAYHLAQAHAFVDGNKRVAFLAALTFLQVNGVVVPDEAEGPVRDLILAIASGRCARDEAAAVLRDVLTG